MYPHSSAASGISLSTAGALSRSAVRRLAGRLAGLAAALGEAGPAEPAQPSRARRPNLCEFDYDHYVELQRRRTRRPARLDRAQAAPLAAELSQSARKSARTSDEAVAN